MRPTFASGATARRKAPYTAPADYVPPVDRLARGKSLRQATPRSAHGAWAPQPNRPDPISLLAEQDADRVPELVPIRYGRMSVSPFAPVSIMMGM